MTKSENSGTELNVLGIARELNGRRKLAKQLLMQVRAIKSSRGANRAREIARLEKSIMMMDRPGMNGKLIEKSVMEASADFLDRWQTAFPELTQNELLLAGFIREGFANADIAVLKGIDPRSVAVSRHRLKSKLGLDQVKGLDEYIRAF
jgi:DNA-binding NarL/FixJ family response regulator